MTTCSPYWRQRAENTQFQSCSLQAHSSRITNTCWTNYTYHVYKKNDTLEGMTVDGLRRNSSMSNCDEDFAVSHCFAISTSFSANEKQDRGTKNNLSLPIGQPGLSRVEARRFDGVRRASGAIYRRTAQSLRARHVCDGSAIECLTLPSSVIFTSQGLLASSMCDMDLKLSDCSSYDRVSKSLSSK